MGLVKGVNSLAVPSEADEYFSTRIESEEWFAVNYDKKAAALVSATGIFDELRWIGVAANDTQLTAFPRRGQYFDPRLGKMVVLDGSETPRRVLQGLFELSLHFLINEGITNDTGRVDTLKVSGIELRDIKAASELPSSVRRVIRPLLVNNGSVHWWRAN